MKKKRICKLLPCSPYDAPSVSAWLEKQAREGRMFDSAFLSLCYFKKIEPVEMKFCLREYDRKGFDGLGRLGDYTVHCTEDLDRPMPKLYSGSMILDGILHMTLWLIFALGIGHLIYLNENRMFTDSRDTIWMASMLLAVLMRIPPALPALIPALRGRYYRFPILRIVVNCLPWLLFILASIYHIILD